MLQLLLYEAVEGCQEFWVFGMCQLHPAELELSPLKVEDTNDKFLLLLI